MTGEGSHWARCHADGTVARVSRAGRTGPWSAGVSVTADRFSTAGTWLSREDAQIAADALAHPGCSGGDCGVWTAVPAPPPIDGRR